MYVPVLTSLTSVDTLPCDHAQLQLHSSAVNQKQQTSTLQQSVHVIACVGPGSSGSGASPCTPTTLNTLLGSLCFCVHMQSTAHAGISHWNKLFHDPDVPAANIYIYITVKHHSLFDVLPCFMMPNPHRLQSLLLRPTSLTHVRYSLVTLLQPVPPTPHPKRAPAPDRSTPTPARLWTSSAVQIQTPAQPSVSVRSTAQSPSIAGNP